MWARISINSGDSGIATALAQSFLRSSQNRSPIGHNHLPNPPKMQALVQDWKQCVNRVERGLDMLPSAAI